MSDIAAFPWARIPRIDRAALTARRELFQRVLGALDPRRFDDALSRVLGTDVEVLMANFSERRVERDQPARPDAFVVQFPAHGVRLSLQPEANLLRVSVARLLEQDFELGWADASIDAALAGAGAALVLELARQAARSEAPELTLDAAPKSGWQLAGRVSLRLGGKPYAIEVCVEALEAPLSPSNAQVGLARLGDVRIALPWICAVSSATLGALERLEPGDIWLPGRGAWLGSEPALSAGVLAPPRSEWGLAVRVSGGRIVLGAETIRVHEELESSMSLEESELEQIVGGAPLVVRLEVGALEMSAAEWAALRPGDVVQSGRRIDDAVILRAGGREIARGELVDIEGELGVRITRVGSAMVAP